MTVLTGNAIEWFRWLQISAAVHMEAKGIRVSRRSITALAKRELKVKGNRDKVLEAIEKKLAEVKATVRPGEIAP